MDEYLLMAVTNLKFMWYLWSNLERFVASLAENSAHKDCWLARQLSWNYASQHYIQ